MSKRSIDILMNSKSLKIAVAGNGNVGLSIATLLIARRLFR